MKRKQIVVVVGRSHVLRTHLRQYLQKRCFVLEAETINEIRDKLTTARAGDAVLALVDLTSANWKMNVEMLLGMRFRNSKPLLIVSLEGDSVGDAGLSFVPAPRIFVYKRNASAQVS